MYKALIFPLAITALKTFLLNSVSDWSAISQLESIELSLTQSSGFHDDFE